MPMQVLSQLNPAPRILLGPGPSDVHPRILTAMATPLLGHLDPQFLEIMNETQELLRKTFRTGNRLTFPVSGTGSAGMETCVVNLIEPGDRMVVCVNGVFGQRMTDVAQRAGAVVSTLERPWGDVFDLDQFRSGLQKVRPKVLGIVHAETSTGAWQPAEELGKLCYEFDTLLLLDTVTSLAGVPVEIDAWGVDAVYSGTQKCLSCPPGLAPVSFSPRAVEAINRRKTKIQSWYLDMTMVQRYWGEERFYHHTAPITMIYALREALRLVHEEGLEARWERHRRHHPLGRNLVRETALSVDDLILPLFVRPGRGVKKEIASMPGNYQLSVDRLVEEVGTAADLGVRAFILFGIPTHKDATGSSALDDEGIVQQALRALREQYRDRVYLMTDECFCEYTDHGHCGVLSERT